MRLSDAGEFGLIRELREILGKGQQGVLLPPGDDAAVIQAAPGPLAYTADAMVEDVHFRPAYVSWHALGYKSLAVNLSDLAAMGGCPPSYALVVLGLPPETEMDDIKVLYGGMMECATEFSCSIAGGDLVGSSRVFVSVSLVGSLPGGVYLTRSGARPGQSIMVTGTLGDSAIGLKWLMKGGGRENPCARKHLYPQPRMNYGRRALEMGATAAIDISDGLLRDLGHICEESGVGARIIASDIPLSEQAIETAGRMGEEPLGAAMYGGEDYELIIVADKGDATGMRSEMGIRAIGEIVEGSGIEVLDEKGQPRELEKFGYDHFKET